MSSRSTDPRGLSLPAQANTPGLSPFSVRRPKTGETGLFGRSRRLSERPQSIATVRTGVRRPSNFGWFGRFAESYRRIRR